MFLLNKQIDLPVIDDDQLAFIILILSEDAVLFFVDRPDELKRYLILEMDGEVSKEEYAFFDDADVGLMDEVFLYIGLDVLQELCLLYLLERGGFLFVVFVLYIAFHLLA